VGTWRGNIRPDGETRRLGVAVSVVSLRDAKLCSECLVCGCGERPEYALQFPDYGFTSYVRGFSTK
jgi:hypothetical protein